MLKKILLLVLVLLIIIQFIHPSRNISTGEQPHNIAQTFNVPTEVKAILDKACMDCHSNNTRYRWYFKIQPVDWWLTYHINEGKQELNLDEYTKIHKNAILNGKEKNTLINWAQGITNEMKVKYPADSLVRKKK